MKPAMTLGWDFPQPTYYKLPDFVGQIWLLWELPVCWTLAFLKLG